MLQQMSRLESGVGTVSDMDVDVKGDALYAKAERENLLPKDIRKVV